MQLQWLFLFFVEGNNYISYNIRGLGGWQKRKDVLKLIQTQRPWILCLQETKLENIDMFVCASMWGPTWRFYKLRLFLLAIYWRFRQYFNYVGYIRGGGVRQQKYGSCSLVLSHWIFLVKFLMRRIIIQKDILFFFLE